MKKEFSFTPPNILHLQFTFKLNLSLSVTVKDNFTHQNFFSISKLKPHNIS